MNNRQRKLAIKELNTKIKEMREKRRGYAKEIKEINSEMDHLKILIEEGDAFSSVEVEDNLNASDVKGVYICYQWEGQDVVLKHFFNLVREEFVDRTKYKEDTLVLKGILNQKLINEHGEPTDLNPGKLVFVSYTPVKEGYAFHVVNVEPKSEVAIIQYQYALSKLGLGEEPKFDHKILADDGQFRTLLTEKGKHE
jgi:hypothetical protein